MEDKLNSPKFENIVEIGETKVGGDGNQIPTTLIGSIFYMRHKIVKDDETGSFDEIAAGSLVECSLELAQELGVGFMLDVIGSTSRALVKYVRFLRNISNTPILINSTSADTRIAAVRELAATDLLDNVIYNSINPFSSQNEIQCLAELPISTAVVQAYNTKSKKADGPLKALIGFNSRIGLLDLASQARITQIMVDIPILDLASVGMIPSSAKVIRERLSVPVGTAPSNATFTSEWLQDRSRVSLEHFRMLNAVVNAYLASNGCNFLFFGPIEGAPSVFPACALIDAVSVYGARQFGATPDHENHPIFKIM